ncbi:MAG: hypothetical protein V3R23_06700 [Nitrospinaceae bacterium]
MGNAGQKACQPPKVDGGLDVAPNNLEPPIPVKDGFASTNL